MSSTTETKLCIDCNITTVLPPECNNMKSLNICGNCHNYSYVCHKCYVEPKNPVKSHLCINCRKLDLSKVIRCCRCHYFDMGQNIMLEYHYCGEKNCGKLIHLCTGCYATSRNWVRVCIPCQYKDI